MYKRQELHIESPRLWHVDAPNLYTLSIRIGEEIHTESFGVRTVGFDPDRGFLLNSKPLKIHGACVHQDFGGVGVALTDNLQRYKIARLKAIDVYKRQPFDMWIHSTQSGTAGGSLPHNAAVNMSFRIPILLHLSNS